MVSALGFGVAYYFDTENGQGRRKRLYEVLRHSVHPVDSMSSSEAGDPPPTFNPRLRAVQTEEVSVPMPPPIREPIASAR